MHIVTLAGSPKIHSKSSSLLAYLSQRLSQDAAFVQHFSLQDLHVPALLSGDVAQRQVDLIQVSIISKPSR